MKEAIPFAMYSKHSHFGTHAGAALRTYNLFNVETQNQDMRSKFISTNNASHYWVSVEFGVAKTYSREQYSPVEN